MTSFFKKHLVVNYLYYSLGIIVPGLLSFLFIPFVTRNYGTQIYAEYSIAFNAMSVVGMFCYGWVGQSYIRFYSKQQAGFEKVASKYLWLSILIGLAVVLISVSYAANINPAFLLFILPAFIASVYYYFFLFAYQAQQNAKKIAISESIRTGIVLLMPLTCSFFFSKEYALYILFISLFLSYLIPVKFILLQSVKSGGSFVFDRIHEKYSEETGRQIKHYGIPVALFLSLSLALSINDRFIIAKILGYKSSGDYSALYDIMNKGVTFICSPVIMTFHPHIVKEYNSSNIKSAYSSIVKSVLLEVLIFVAGFIGLWLLAPYLLTIIYKNAVPENSIHLAYILYAAVFIWQFAMLFHKPLELQMQTKWMALGVLIAFFLNVGFNYFLIGHYRNVFIAAYTTLGASLFYLVYVNIFSLKHNLKMIHNYKLVK